MPVEAVDLRQIFAKSPRRRRMAAVCAQLGERASVRNVQRVTGGSHRDVGLVVRAWRKQQDVVAAMLGTDSSEAMRSLGAIVLSATAEFREDQSRQAAELTATLRRLEAKLDLQRLPGGLAQQAAVDRQFQGLAARLDTLVRKLDEAQVVTSADPNAALARSMQRLQSEVATLATTVAAWRREASATEPFESLRQAVGALEQRLNTLGRTRAAPSKPPAIPATLERRLERVNAALAHITEQLKQQAARRRRVTKRRLRAATRTVSKKIVRRHRDQQRRTVTRKRTRVSSPPADRPRRVAGAKRPKATPQAQRRAVTPSRRRSARLVTPGRARRKPVRATSTARARPRGARHRLGHRRPRRHPKR